MEFAMLPFLSQYQNIVTDKLDATFTGRSTEYLERQVEKLPQAVKKELASDILRLRAYYVHMYNFDPSVIINSEFDN